MGKLVYGASADSFEIEDAVLAHLRIVAMNKLRRGEPFFLHVPARLGTRSLWIHPSISLVFHFYGGRHPAIDREWVEELMMGASGPTGLELPGFPPTTAARGAASHALAVDSVDHSIHEAGDEIRL